MAVAAQVHLILTGGMVDTADVAHVAHTSQRSVQRWHAERAVPRKVAEARLLELSSVISLAQRTMSVKGARLWLRTPMEPLDWLRPLDAISEGRFRQVIDILKAMQEGVIR
jgi:uncharacterized protein (DUF2384 family)